MGKHALSVERRVIVKYRRRLLPRRNAYSVKVDISLNKDKRIASSTRLIYQGVKRSVKLMAMRTILAQHANQITFGDMACVFQAKHFRHAQLKVASCTRDCSLIPRSADLA